MIRAFFVFFARERDDDGMQRARGGRLLFTIGLATALAATTGCGGSTPSSLTTTSGVLDRARWPEAEASPRARAALAFASAQIGKPYCWGGTGPRCFDCSGLVQTAWGTSGARLPRTSHDIARHLPEVDIRSAQPGDILWWPGHVGLYAGNGWMIDAYDSRHGVVQRRVAEPRRVFRPAER